MKTQDHDPTLSLGVSQPQPAVANLSWRIAEWKLEPELAVPVPRRVALRWYYLATTIVLGGLFLFVGLLTLVQEDQRISKTMLLLLFGGLLYGCERQRQLSKHLVTRATATGGTISKSLGPSGRHLWSYSIEYHVPTRHEVVVSLEKGRAIGDTLTVLYLPEAPEKAMAYKDCLYKALVAPEENK